MVEEDLQSLRQVLARAVQASGLLRRDIERALRLRNGSLGRLLDGTLELKVEHLTALGRLLRIPPGDLLAAGCPQLRAAAPHRLIDWLGPAGNASAPAAASSLPPTPEEMAEMIRAVLRRELAAREGE